MAKEYRLYTREEKMRYAKKFTKSQRESYHKGIRNGFLQGIHKNNNKDVSAMKQARKRYYTEEEYNSFFDDVKNIEI